MKTLNPCLALVASLLVQASQSPARAQSYRMWTDAEGTVHLTDGDDPPPQQGKPPAQASDQGTRSSRAAPKAGDKDSLKKFELPYLGHEGSARRVIVQVQFEGGVTAPMALDTGAPGMILSVELAERLGVFSRDQGKLVIAARGIGGGVPAVRTILERVSIGGAQERFVPVTITPRLSEAFDGLVGMDFMSQYSMTIDPSRKVVVLQEQPLPAEAPGGHVESWWRGNFQEFRTLRDAWRQFHARIEQNLSESQVSAGASRDELMAYQRLADLQYQEAEKLLSRLERYASTQSVPRHWR